MEHDLITHARSGVTSRLASGMYSVELACFEVQTKRPKTWNWRDKLCDKALDKWAAEVAASPKDTWGGRLVVFVQLERPCHSNNANFSTHGALVNASTQTLEVLWGWNGFPLSDREPTADYVEAASP